MGYEKFRRKGSASGTFNAKGGLYSGGVPVFGSERMAVSGSVFHVGSTLTGASDNNSGMSPDQALATIDAGINKCTASKGDMVVVHENHAETITGAAGIALDLIGVSIVGLGQGAARPTVTFATNNAASCDISAASTRISNLLFLNDKDGQTAMINVTADDVTIEGCEFREGSAKQPGIYINVGAANNDADRLKIYGCKITSVTAGATSAISLTQLQDGVEIVGNIIDGDFDDAGIQNPTGEICTNLLIANNYVRNRQTGDHAIQLVSACTGWLIDNRLAGDTLGTILDPGSLFCLGNLETDAIDQAGVDSPRVAAGGFPDDSITAAAIATGAFDADAIAADTILGADNNNNAFASTNVASNADGSIIEREEWLQAQVGALVNTGGTATIGGILGDLANDSLVARLNDVGSNVDGTTTDTLQGKLGTDTEMADRSMFDLLVGDGPASFPAAAAPANDVSLAEVLRAVYEKVAGGALAATSNPLLGVKVTKATADVFGVAAVPVFTVSGGRVLVTHFEAEVTTQIGAGANNFKYQFNPTVGTTTDMCANLDIDADDVGTLYTLHGAAATALQRSEHGNAPGMAIRGVVLAEGDIEAFSAGNVTGSASHEMWYFPLDSGASVASA